MADAIFLPKVIEYDRFQPEFYEDTFTYIKKRSSNSKVREGLKIYKKNKNIIEVVEKEFIKLNCIILLRKKVKHKNWDWRKKERYGVLVKCR